MACRGEHGSSISYTRLVHRAYQDIAGCRGALDKCSVDFTIREVRKYSHYHFRDRTSFDLWTRARPLRYLDCTLGYPILLCDEDGEYVTLDSKSEACRNLDDVLNGTIERKSVLTRHVRDLIRSQTLQGVQVCTSGINGKGVFATQAYNEGDYVGLYGGTVMTEEDWEANKPDGAFIFVLHHGAQGVVVDGEVGPVNALKYLNHSCFPNVKMLEVFEDGCWNVAVVAVRSIPVDEELTHDYELTTEDPDDPSLKIKCGCGSTKCRGNFVELREW